MVEREVLSTMEVAVVVPARLERQVLPGLPARGAMESRRPSPGRPPTTAVVAAVVPTAALRVQVGSVAAELAELAAAVLWPAQPTRAVVAAVTQVLTTVLQAARASS